jgi:hypothetical protein
LSLLPAGSSLKEVTSPSNLSSESPENMFGTILLNCTCVVVGGLQKKSLWYDYHLTVVFQNKKPFVYRLSKATCTGLALPFTYK